MAASRAPQIQQGGIVRSPDLTGDPDVFPLLPGCPYPKKGPQWSTTVLVSKSGRQFVRQNWSSPTWQFSLSFNSLNQIPARKDLDRLFAFYNQHAGQFGFFYYFDPDDNVVSGQSIGVGNGVTTEFQLIRSFQGWSEPIFAITGTPVVTVGGNAVTDYSIVAPGVINFTSPPALGANVAWTGQFMFLCHFTQDQLDAQQLNDHLFSNDGLTFETLKL